MLHDEPAQDPRALAIDLIGVTRDIVWSRWHNCKAERGEMGANGDARLEPDEDADTISMYIGVFEQIYIGSADLLVGRGILPTWKLINMDPPYLGPFLDKWKILEAPNISQWIRKYGHKYPAYCDYVFSVEMLRTLLIRFRRDFPDDPNVDNRE